jgi:cytochrome c-type biogenesis protein CcmH
MRTRASLLLIVGLLLLPASAAVADDQARVVRLSKNIMSPFCPGLTLHDCPSDAAIELRSKIADQVEAGLSDDEIMERLEQQYGPVISAVPNDGRSWLVWGLPATALLGGGVIAYLAGRRWTALRVATTEPTPVTSADKERIEQELRSIREGWSEGR